MSSETEKVFKVDPEKVKAFLGTRFFPVATKEERETWGRRREVGLKLYQTGDVVQMLDVAARQLEYWIQIGVVRPDHPAGGKGSRRNFTYKNLVQVLLVDSLWKSGITADEVRSVLARLTGLGYFDRLTTGRHDDKPAAILVKDNSTAEIRDDDVQLEELKNGHKTITYINLPRIERCVQEAVAAKLGSD